MTLLISLIVYGLFLWLLWWGLGKIGLPEPFNKVAIVILVVISIYIVWGLLTGAVSPIHLNLNLK